MRRPAAAGRHHHPARALRSAAAGRGGCAYGSGATGQARPGQRTQLARGQDRHPIAEHPDAEGLLHTAGRADRAVMIHKRLVAGLRGQNWSAIAIELAIVIVGVFIGTQVANWNQARLEKQATERMLVQLVPELRAELAFFANVETYYATTRRYAEQAMAGWQGSSAVSDSDFVIAAYQATQVNGIGINPDSWSLTFGGDQLRNIEDPKVRRNLEVVLTSDYRPVEFAAVATQYREQVRHIIPIDIQDQIRE